MLYIKPLFKLGTSQPGRKRSRFGYADDVAILACSRSLEDNCKLLVTEWKEALEWDASEGITFDLDKSELIHFTKRLQDKDKNPSVIVALPDGRPYTVQPLEQNSSLRWLGVHFDRKLSFKTHVQILSANAVRAANGLRSLGNTIRGAPAHLLRRAITACVLPI